MSNQIQIDFSLCDVAPVNGYRVRYHPQAGGPLLTWPVRFFASPAVFDDGGAEPDGTLYQGFLDADCGPDGFGDQVAWATPEESASASASASASTSSSIPPPPCVPVEFTEGSVPDGTIGDIYSVDLHLTGDAPFTLGSVTKPSWMTVTLVGSTIQLRGIPDAEGTGETLTIDVSNCDTVDTDTFSGTLDVVNAMRYENTDEYSGDGGAITGICHAGVTIFRNSEATADATANGQSVRVHFNLDSDGGGALHGQTVDFGPTTTSVGPTTYDLDIGGPCSSVTISIISIELI